MSRPKPSLEAALRRESAVVGPHPGRVELLEFSLDEVTAERADEIREHLSTCPRCQGTLRDLTDLPLGGAEAAEMPAGETGRQWERLQQRFSGPESGSEKIGGGGNLSQKD